MPHRHLRHLAAVCAAIALTTALAACGDDAPDASDVPEGAVAVVGDTEITQEAFDHWVANTARTQGLKQIPDPPEFEKCIAAQLKLPRAKGVPKPKEADMRTSCTAQWEQLRTSTMTFLIQAEINFQAAEDLDLVLTAADAREARYPKEKDYRAALKISRLSEKDYLYQLRAQALPTEVNTQLQANEGTVSEDEARDYYESHEAEFGHPESRTTTMITSASKAKSEQAKKRLDAGDSWEDVAAKLAAPTMPGAIPTTFTAEQAGKGVVAVFKAKKDEIVGPVRTDTGWAVFKVDVITPSGTTPFDTAVLTLIDKLRGEREQKATMEFQEKSKERTVCAEEYILPICANAPPPEVPEAPEPPSGE